MSIPKTLSWVKTLQISKIMPLTLFTNENLDNESESPQLTSNDVYTPQLSNTTFYIDLLNLFSI